MKEIQKDGKRRGSRRAHATVLCLTLSAVMAALSMLICRLVLYLIPLSGMYRIDIGFLPIAAVAILAGPVWAGAAYGAADLIGALLTTGMNFGILACKILTGVILGILLYRKRPGIIPWPFCCYMLFCVSSINSDRSFLASARSLPSSASCIRSRCRRRLL